MKPGLVLPQIGNLDAISSERIDEHVRIVAEHINGGLTVENLAPSLRLTTAQFAESNSLYVMEGQGPVGSGGPNALGILGAGAAAKPIAVSIKGRGSAGVGASLTSQQQFVFLSNGAAFYRTPTFISTSRLLTVGDTTKLASLDNNVSFVFFTIDSAVTIAAGQLITYTWTPGTYPYSNLSIRMIFAAAHST